MTDDHAARILTLIMRFAEDGLFLPAEGGSYRPNFPLYLPWYVKTLWNLWIGEVFWPTPLREELIQLIEAVSFTYPVVPDWSYAAYDRLFLDRGRQVDLFTLDPQGTKMVRVKPEWTSPGPDDGLILLTERTK